MRPIDHIDGTRVTIRAHTPADVPELVALRLRNRDFLESYEPRRSEGFFTEAGQRAEIRRDLDEWAADRMYAFGVIDRSDGALCGPAAPAGGGG